MFTNFRSRLSGGLAPRLQVWASDGGHDQQEGERLLGEGACAAAELHLARALVDAEKKRAFTGKRIRLRLALAEAQRRQFQADDGSEHPEKLEAAEETVRSALELASRSADREAHVRCLDALSAVLADQGRSEEHERIVEEATRLESGMSRPDLTLKALRLHRLGAMRLKTGRISDAVSAFEEAVALNEQVHGPEHLETAHQLTELGDACRYLGQHAKAQKCLYRAMRIHERECGIDSTEAVHDLHLLTDSFEASGNVDAAAAQHERVLGLKLRMVGADLEELAGAQMSLAGLYARWENYSRSRELLMEAIGTFKRKKGLALAAAYEALASVEERSGLYADAVREMARAAAVWETIQPQHARELARNLEYRAQLLEKMKLSKDAAFLRERASELAPAESWAAAS